MGRYPQTVMEFERLFATEEACRAHLVGLRWPEGFRCPGCDHRAYWLASRGRLVCQRCQRQTWVTAGTIFHRSHQPLRVWLRAIWWVTNQKIGVSALGLQRTLGLGSYQTAWVMLHKLRRAMVRPGREALTGAVEVDESFLGGVEPGGGRRHMGHKALLGVAAEIRGRGTGRIRLERLRDATRDSLHGFIRRTVAKGATIVTDGLLAYGAMAAAGYRHVPRVGSGEHTRLRRVHRVVALLKRWLLGTHQGRVERDHLPSYLDEFVFRFNRRASTARGQLFGRVLEHAVQLPPTPYRRLIHGQGFATHKI